MVLSIVFDVAKRIDTVIEVGVSTRCDDEGRDRMLAPLLTELGYGFERAKTNMGLGRITNRPSEERGYQHAAPIR